MLLERATSPGENFGNVQVRERVAQVPAHGLQDHLARILAALEGIRRRDRHGLPTLPDPPQIFAMEPVWSIVVAICGQPGSTSHLLLTDKTHPCGWPGRLLVCLFERI